MLPATELTTALQELGPPGVAYSLCRLDGELQPLWATELTVSASMSKKRQREFTAGRTCARQALAKLGHVPVALAIGPGRAPVWPAGIIGSISHTDEIAIAAVARQAEIRSLGIDVESADPLEAKLLSLVCRDEERTALADCGSQTGTAAKLIFSAKESVYKCLWPVTGMFLEFHTIGIRIDPAHCRFTVYGEDPRIAATLDMVCGAYRRVAGLLLSCAWLDHAGTGQRSGREI